jgi:hypothetical protein
MMMKKLKHLVLMLCLTLSGAWCYAYGVAGTENGKDGTPIEVIEKTSVTESDKSNSIVPTIDGHVLSLMFSENLGEVAVEITTVSGTLMENLWVRTPNGLQTYLPLCGDYIITFTLPNGDEYYGEFTVTN